MRTLVWARVRIFLFQRLYYINKNISEGHSILSRKKGFCLCFSVQESLLLSLVLFLLRIIGKKNQQCKVEIFF